MHVLTAEEMREIERTAMDSGTASDRVLMERAGCGAVATILEEWPDLAPGRVLILCGPGNNGGDGFVVARLLHGLGWTVDLRLLGDPGKLPPDAAANHAAWSALGDVTPLVDGTDKGDPDLIVDALFGTGLTRPVDLPETLGLLRTERRAKVVALDMPSGWCSDSGRRIGARAAEAHLTLAFHAAKRGHVLGDAPEACGMLRVIDIGLPDTGDGVRLVGAPNGLAKAGGHKYAYGHALVLGGGPGKGGAARMTSRAALRVGAGLVTLAVPPAALQENAARLDAVMLSSMRDADALAEMLEDTRLNAVALGPGLGSGGRTRELVRTVLAADRACVLDADALTAFAQAPDDLFGMLHPKAVLTPHGGEFARLFPDLANLMNGPVESGPAFSRLDAAQAAADRAGCTVLLKGPDTVIASPDDVRIHAALYDRSAPGLATAGAGDTLTGFIAGLLARGLDPVEAAGRGAWLLTECALRFGPGLIAEDLPEVLPGVLAELAAHAPG
ncbi:NAD(P)H-hydrate dehydratase [Palleronia abyssalis]|uniref:Bifunctional NAD(P)H-hydrate repair enzyme n=1 Tax=Palleronia abyssalis TaxID=1501240 RepID=A0A2R8BRY1_9RHOB|nr:NAD(P)H-hydrate dehydratase [Palleronia abyssalis]SPJ22919.1 Bifunctional NAD(P)H-hydrate repair enzyme Nnr [Palleronia abyssalis]